MSESELTPGKHLRKNQKQITAMMRAAVVQAGLEWQDEPQGSGRGTARGTRDGETVVEIRYQFGTGGVEVAISSGGEEVKAPGLYTDTSLIMEALRGVLAKV